MDYIALIGYIVSVITAFGGWFLGRHTRKSTAIATLMSTIEGLSKQVSDYQSRIMELQDEIIAVRKENAELKAGQEEMTRKIDELKAGQNRIRSPGPHGIIQ